MESNPVGHDSYGLYVLNGMGELQARMLRFPERRAAMAAAWAQLRLRVGCFALVARMRYDAWVSCGVFALTEGRLAAMSDHRRHEAATSMDANTIPPGLFAGASARNTMDII
ncbi:MAG: hypothetical protein NTV86_09775 [Planctomycetota bacterium]|nr:hypothetical protein [Planctomycetota bacterium]